MKIASYNVNGINGRLPVLPRWQEETKPGIVCLQEFKALQEKFPEQESAIWLDDALFPPEVRAASFRLLDQDAPRHICRARSL